MKIFCKKTWFTLIEIIVAMTIWTIVIVWIVFFIWKMNEDISMAKAKTIAYLDTVSLINKINQSRLIYKKNLIVNDSDSWNDIILLYSSWSEWWLLMWVVDATNNSDNYLKLDPDDNFDIYWKKLLWIRKITETQTLDLISNTWSVFWIPFYEDNLFWWLFTKKLEARLYNSWAFLDLNLDIITNYSETYNGSDFNNVSGYSILNINLNF